MVGHRYNNKGGEAAVKPNARNAGLIILAIYIAAAMSAIIFSLLTDIPFFTVADKLDQMSFLFSRMFIAEAINQSINLNEYNISSFTIVLDGIDGEVSLQQIVSDENCVFIGGVASSKNITKTSWKNGLFCINFTRAFVKLNITCATRCMYTVKILSSDLILKVNASTVKNFTLEAFSARVDFTFTPLESVNDSKINISILIGKVTFRLHDKQTHARSYKVSLKVYNGIVECSSTNLKKKVFSRKRVILSKDENLAKAVEITVSTRIGKIFFNES